MKAVRTRGYVLAGAALGVVASALVSRAPLAGDVAITSHFLFLVGLPWSLVVFAANVGAMLITGGDRLSILLFYAMPVVAGAGWGWVAAAVRGRLRRRAGDPAVRVSPAGRS